MSDWKEYLLGEHIEVVNGFAFKSSNFLYEKESNALPIIKIKNVANGDVNLDGVQYHFYENSLLNYVLSNGDVLVALTGNHPQVLTQVVGGVSRYKLHEPALLNQRVAKIKAKPTLNIDFLYYFLKDNSIHLYLANQSSGSANQANISKSDIENISLQLPSLPEQLQIASILSSLDDKIDLLHRQNKTLEQLAETLFRQWFVEEAEESWDKKPLGNYVVVKRGGSPRPIQDYISETGLNWLKIADVTGVGSPYIFEIKEKIKVEGLNKTTFLKKGSLILSNSATPGIPKILDVDSCIHDGWMHFPKSKFSNEFLYLFFKSIRPELLQLGNGSIFTNLKTDILKEFVLTIPDDKSLNKFDNQIKPIFQKLYSNTTQIRTLTQLRDTLLPKLMSGEVRVKIE
jgi:type I restriction enzyme S subunit